MRQRLVTPSPPQGEPRPQAEIPAGSKGWGEGELSNAPAPCYSLAPQGGERVGVRGDCRLSERIMAPDRGPGSDASAEAARAGRTMAVAASRALAKETESAGDHAFDRLAGLGVLRQRRGQDALLHFKPHGRLVRPLWDGFVGVGGQGGMTNERMTNGRISNNWHLLTHNCHPALRRYAMK